MTVLIVDDNEPNLRLLRAILSTSGINVVEATDGVRALEILKRGGIDVIISDILMPNMDGYHLCFEIRHNEQLKKIGVILYTATDFTPEDEKRAFELGADKFLKKHGSAQKLLAAVQEAAEISRSGLSRNEPAVQEFPKFQVMKTYNEAMIRKLEEKNIELDQAHEELKKANEVLELRVQERTAALEAANKELESFSYSVSHDLRAPLRWIDGYTDILVKECSSQLSADGLNALQNIQKAGRRMTQLIDDLLDLAQINRRKLSVESVDLSLIATEISQRLRQSDSGRRVEVIIQPDMVASGDRGLLTTVLENLLENAWKYTSKTTEGRIEVGKSVHQEKAAFFVRDNGVGFDSKYASKLFSPFQRMHSESEFPGTGIGLATVQRIVHRHGGHIWFESAPEQGATFYFTLRPPNPND